MKFTKAFFKHPWFIIITCLFLTGFFGFFLKDLKLENSMRQFFPQKNEAYTRLTDTEETFGSMLAIGASIEAETGSILTPEYLSVIKKITDRVSLLSEVDTSKVNPSEKSVDSLTHIDYLCADEYGAISASQLIPPEYFDENSNYIAGEDGIQELKKRLTEWDDMYNRVIINDNNTAAQLQITLKTTSTYENDIESAKRNLENAKASADEEEIKTAEKALKDTIDAPSNQLKAAKENLKKAKASKNAEEIKKASAAYEEAKSYYDACASDSVRQQNTLTAIRKIVEEECKGHDVKYKLVGEPVLSESSRKFMTADLLGLIPLVIIVVLISLYLSFKTLEGTILPLITVVMSTAISCGLMGLFGITFTLVSSVIPVALIAVGSAYGIHVLTHYYIAVKKAGGELTKESYRECVFEGLRDVWKAVILAGITTAVGFISLVTSPIEPLHSFAIFTAVGVGISLLLSITFIPAILLVKDYRKIGKKNENSLSQRVKRRAEKMRAKIEYQLARRGGKSVDEASGNTLYLIFRFFCGTKIRLIITSVAIIVFSIAGLRLLKIDTALINYFPEDCQFRQDIDYIDERFAGTNSIFFNVISPDAHKAREEEGSNLIEETSEEEFNFDEFDFDSTLEEDSFEADDSFEEDFDFDFDAALEEESSEEVTASTNITNPEILKSVDDMNKYLLSKHDGIGKIVALPTFIKRVNQVWNAPGSQEESSDYLEKLNAPLTNGELLEKLNHAYIEAGGKYASVEGIIDILMKDSNFNGSAFYEIPYDPEKYPQDTREALSGIVANYLDSILSGSASISRFIDSTSQPQIMRITCQLRVHTTDAVESVINDAKEYADLHFPEGYTLESTGSSDMEVVMTDMIVESQISSLAISLISVFLIITLAFKSGWAGILGAIPLAFAILLNYMIMGFAGINLDLVTSIIASLAVGVGIDYTIHFLSTYKEERSKSSDIEYVTKQTFEKSGHGIITNALAVGFGFLVLCLSKFVVLRYIGVLVALVMFTSSFLAMTIIPGILTLLDPKFIKPKAEK